MNSKLLVFACLVLAVNCYPAPTDPSDDVELIKPVNTNTDKNVEVDETSFDENIPVIIIRTRPVFSDFNFGRRPSIFSDPFFNRGTFSSGFPFGDFVFPQDDDQDEPKDVTRPKFGVKDDEVTIGDDEAASSCGFLCLILKNLEDHVKQLDDEFHQIFNQTTASNDDNDKGYDIFNKTYTEKVLPDGTIVKVNRTVIADTSDDGNSFFFHSTSFHNTDTENDSDIDSITDAVSNTDTVSDTDTESDGFEYPEIDAPKHEFSPSKEEKKPEASPVNPVVTSTLAPVIPNIEDDSFNEVDDKIDDGLTSGDAVQ